MQSNQHDINLSTDNTSPFLHQNDIIHGIDTKTGEPKDYKTDIVFMNERINGKPQYAVILEGNNLKDNVELPISHFKRSSIGFRDIDDLLKRDYHFQAESINKQKDIKELKYRHKYPDWPFKRIKSLTNSNNRKNMNYEICEGRIVDPELIDRLGTNHAYYQKAIHSFNVNVENSQSGIAKATIDKGQVSGPIVLSNNKDAHSAQIKQLKDMANSRFMRDRKLDHAGAKQNFWLDQNSYLKGDTNLPANGLLVNSQIDSNKGKGHGLDMDRVWMYDTYTNNYGNAVLFDTSFAQSAIDNHGSFFSNGYCGVNNKINNIGHTSLTDSYADNVVFDGENQINDAQLVNKTEVLDHLRNTKLNHVHHVTHYVNNTHTVNRLQLFNKSLNNRNLSIDDQVVDLKKLLELKAEIQRRKDHTDKEEKSELENQLEQDAKKPPIRSNPRDYENDLPDLDI